MEPRSSFYTARRLRLHYLEWGDPEAPPVILVHGGRDHARQWDAVARDLAERFRVIVPELAGHGDSEWISSGDYRINGYAYDIAHLIDVLDLAPLPVVGHSMGGHIAIRLAAARPEAVTRLISIEGLGPPPKMLAEHAARSVPEQIRRWLDDAAAIVKREPRRYATVESAAQRMREENNRLSSELALHLTRYGLRQNEDGSWSWKFDNRFYLIAHERSTVAELQALWSAVACRALLVYGAESWASNPAEDGRAAYFSNAEVATIERAGHWPHHDRPDIVLPIIRAFLVG